MPSTRSMELFVAMIIACSSRFAVALIAVAGLAAGNLRAQRPDAATVANAVDSLAARVVTSGLAPAFGVAVVMDGQTVLSKSYGHADATRGIPVRPSTLWYIASTSKSFTGFAVELLAYEGALDLQAPITRLLPNARWQADVDASRLTLTHFLSHTHHLSDGAVVLSAAFTAAMPEDSWPALLRFSAPSGNADLVYSNLGYNVAAMAIDVARPEGWKRFMQRRLLDPLGLRNTYMRIGGVSRDRIAMPHDFLADGSQPTLPFLKTDATMNAAGGHLATLDDLARWVTVHIDSGRIDGRQLLPAEAIAQSQMLLAEHTRAPARRFAMFDRIGWSAGWDIGAYEGERMVSRFGSYSTTRSHLSFLPGRRIGVVALTTGRIASAATDVVAAFAYDLEAGRHDARARANARLDSLIAQRSVAMREIARSDSVRAARQRSLGRSLSDFAGTYRNDGLGTFRVRVENERLHWRWGVLRGIAEVFDADRHALRIELAGTGSVVEFDLPSSGAATAMSTSGARFVRVR